MLIIEDEKRIDWPAIFNNKLIKYNHEEILKDISQL
jgi:hypothetical protein